MRGGRTLGSQLRLRPWRRAAWLELSLGSREKAPDYDRFPRITLTFFSYVIGKQHYFMGSDWCCSFPGLKAKFYTF